MFTDDLLKGKRILITGGGTGIGRAMAERFLQLGAIVFICGRRAEVVQKTAQELSASTGGTIEGFPCDVRYPEDVEPLIEQLWAKGPLDVLVNNAAGNFLARTEELSPHAFDAVISIVLKGTINMTLACGRRWLATKRPGVVLNIATTYADTGSAFVVPSAVAKAGVVALMRSLAVEWGGRGIRFVAIAPGAIRTEGAFFPLAAHARTGKGTPRSQSPAPLRYAGGDCQPGRVPHQRSGRLHQRRNGVHGRRRDAGRLQQFQHDRSPPARLSLADDEPQENQDRIDTVREIWVRELSLGFDRGVTSAETQSLRVDDRYQIWNLPVNCTSRKSRP